MVSRFLLVYFLCSFLILLRTILDREIQGTYTFYAYVHDGPDKPIQITNTTVNKTEIQRTINNYRSHTASIMITITIQDENDNDPVFIRPNSTNHMILLNPTAIPGQSLSQSMCTIDLVWDPVKAPDIRFSYSHFRKQQRCHEKAMSGTSLAEAIYAWLCESISRGRADSPHSRPYQGIWGQAMSIIDTLLAIDPDEGLNGQVSYAIKGETAGILFNVDPRTGLLYLESQIPRQYITNNKQKTTINNQGNDLNYPTFLLGLDACDHGEPRRCTHFPNLQIQVTY
ncbi:unnamed protein product [Schistosoma curassoni]|uniref:Cadherin domain-containing protein n=1 Tax=Schistosoma curassoni TaxID=6186 RepID=A0A3P8AYY8_9TREM|nr:unnamed protein product [Schistosoma curassoni]